MPFNAHDAWRAHPMLRLTRAKHMFPGFGTAAAIFAVYCVGDMIFGSSDSGHHAPPALDNKPAEGH